MLKNYFEIDENTTVNAFLKDLSEKKNSQYIILDTVPKYFVDTRTVALKSQNQDEKLKNLKKPLSKSSGNTQEEYFLHLMASGDRVIETDEGFYDFVDALEFIKNSDFSFLTNLVSQTPLKEIYALNLNDKIAAARNLFLKHRVNILPVIEDKKIIGEVRPMDLLVNNLYSHDMDRGDFYDTKKKGSLWNLLIENLLNKKPLIVEQNQTYKFAIDLMIKKKVPSIIISDNEELFTVLSYNDIFKLAGKTLETSKYNVEYNGISELFEEELDLIKDMVEKSMDKIIKISNYDNIKISFKTHGNTQGTHKKKFQVKILLSHGNKILNIDKEVSRGTNDEESNDRVNQSWNTPQMVQESLSILESKVKEEKRKS